MRRTLHRYRVHRSLATVLLATVSLAGGLATGGARAQTAPIETRLARLEARLDELESESQIRHKLDQYMDVLGASDWDKYVLFFAEDGELHMAEGVRKGRGDIKERMAGAAARMANAARGRPQRQRADLLSNVRVDVHGDTATARSRFTFLGEDEYGGFHVTGSGHYTDTWVRVDGDWLIQRRSVDWDMLRGASPAPAATN